jgi:hypothetical protein
LRVTTRSSPKVLIWSIKLGSGAQVLSNMTADTEMMTLGQRWRLMWIFELRTVVTD